MQDNKSPNTSGGDQPKHRIVDANKAVNMVQSARIVCDSRLDAWHEVQNMLDRTPPDDPAKLEQNGLGGVANIDWGYMRDGIESAVAPKLHIATRPHRYINLGCRNQAIPRMYEQLRVLEEEDRIMMDDWGEFEVEMEAMLVNQKSTGLGIMRFEQPTGWFMRHLHPANLITPANASTNPDRWDWCAMKVEFDLTQVLKMIADKEASKVAGYDQAVARRFVDYAVDGGDNLLGYVDQYSEDFIYGRELYSQFHHWDDQTLEGGAYIVYVREFDGTISESGLVKSMDGDHQWEWLYRKEECHQQMSEAFCLFPDSIGQTILRKIRGYGVEMLPTYDGMNRLKNQTLDHVLLTSSMVFTGKKDSLKHFNEMIFGGPFLFVPDALDFQQKAFGDTGNKLLGMNQMFGDMATGQNLVNGGATDGREAPVTATGEQIRFHEGRQSAVYEMEKFNKQLSNLHRQRFKRVWSKTTSESAPGYKLAEEMIQRATARGVIFDGEDTVIKSIHPQEVKAGRSIGNGNMNETLMKLSASMQYYGNQMSPEGRRNWAEDVSEALHMDETFAGRHLGPREGEGDEESISRWDYQQENAQFLTDVVIMPKNIHDHVQHLQGHARFITGIDEKLEAGQMPLGFVIEVMTRAYQHSSAHIQMLSADPAMNEMVAEANRFWNEKIVNRIKQLQSQLEKQQEAEAKAQAEAQQVPQISPKEAGELDLDRFRLERELEMKQQESDARVRATLIEAEARAKRIEVEKNMDLANQEE